MRSRKALAVVLTFLMLLMPAFSVSGVSVDVCQQHDWVLEDPMTDSTCTRGGMAYYVCSICGYGEVRAIPPTGHLWGSWIEEEAPTCTETGYRVRCCELCGNLETETLPLTDHTWTEWITVTPATCTSAGTEVRSCTNCEAEQTREIPGGAHEWGKWTTETPATCTHVGSETRVCANCGAKQTREIPHKDHEWGDVVIIRQPTCEEEGEQSRKCVVCGYEESKILECTPHSFGEWIVYREPTLFDPGERQRRCTICGCVISDTDYLSPDALYRGNENNDKEAVQQLQQALNDAGYDCGAADGIFGEKTENAVKEFQKDHGMNPTGIVFPGLMMILAEEVDSYEPSIDAYEDMPVLWLTVKQTSPQKEKYQPLETVSYDWTVKNIGGEDVDFDQIIFEFGGAYYTILPGIGEDIYDGPTQTLEKHGGSISGSSEIQLHEKFMDTDLTIVMFKALGIIPGNTQRFYESNGVYLEYLMDPESVQQPEEDPTCVPDEINEPEETDGTETDPADYSSFFEDSGIVLEKECISTPGNGEYFVPDEEIVFRFTIRNTGEKTYTDVRVDDFIGMEVIPAVSYESVLPGFEQTFTTSYIVSDYDAIFDFLQDYGCAYGTEEDCEKYLAMSNVVYTRVGQDGTVKKWEKVTVEKEESTKPENGLFYVEGETIGYKISVCNHGRETVENVWLYDALYSYEEAYGYAPEIHGGTSESFEFYYQVTAEDAACGFVNNYAFICTESRSEVVYSDEVFSRCGSAGEEAAPDDYGAEEHVPLLVEKRETTTPSNGSYYQEGETIGYEISVTNIGETTLPYVDVYDVAETELGNLYAYIHLGYTEELDPGSTEKYTYEWEVDSYDVMDGFHNNTAYAVYPLDTVNINVDVWADVVVSPCGAPEPEYTEEPTEPGTEPGAPAEGTPAPENPENPENPETPTDPGTEPGAPAEGTPEPEKPETVTDPGTEPAPEGEKPAENPVKTVPKENEKPVGKIEKPVSVKADTEEEAADCCSRTLKAKGDRETLYDVHYCDAHQAILDQAEELSAEGAGKEEQAEAWEKIGILWSNEVSAQYADYIRSSRGDAAEIVAKERNLYFEQMKAYRASLELAYPEEPETVEEILAVAYRNKCIDLCYERSTAPEERTDSVMRDSYEHLEEESEQPGDCEDTIQDQEEKEAHHQILFCEDHVKTKNAADVLLSAATNTEEYLNGFKVAQMLWQAKLDSFYSEWYLDSGEEDREIIAADRIAYGEWLEQREQLLELLYPENPEVVEEVLMNEISSRVVDICR